MAGFGASVFRAVAMLMCRFLAGYLGKTYDALSAMALSAMLLLADSPYLLFQSGFQLSFGACLLYTSIEYKLLCLLAKNVGKVLTHTFITQKIWGSSWDNDIASLRVFMATLRKKLEAAPDSPQYIQTHIGVGYRMLRVE